MDLEPEPEIAFQQQLEHTVTKQKKKRQKKDYCRVYFFYMLKYSAVDCLVEGMQLWMRLECSCAPSSGTGFLWAVRSVPQFLCYKRVGSMRRLQNTST